jgi:hypothetical protein
VGEALALIERGPEGGVLHAERREEAGLQEVGVGHAADDLDDAAGGVDAGVVVFEFRARLLAKRDAGVVGDLLLQVVGIVGLVLGPGELLVGGDAAEMAEDFLDGDRVIGGMGCFVGADPIDFLLALEFREVLFDGIVEADLAFVDEHHEGGCGYRFGHGGDPEEIVGLHGRLVGEAGIAEGFGVEDLVFVGDEDDESAGFFLVDVGLENGGERTGCGRGRGGRGGVLGEGGKAGNGGGKKEEERAQGFHWKDLHFEGKAGG